MSVKNCVDASGRWVRQVGGNPSEASAEKGGLRRLDALRRIPSHLEDYSSTNLSRETPRPSLRKPGVHCFKQSMLANTVRQPNYT